MTPQRITVKYFVRDPAAVNLPEFIPVFHRWIQNKTVAGLLIDVADYKHVYEGPGVVLVGHDVDYAIDLDKGQTGLLCRRKRLGNKSQLLREHLQDAFRLVLRAAHTLESDPALQAKIQFRTDQVELTFPDRLNAPNTQATFERLSDEFRAVLHNLYPDVTTDLEQAETDPRQPFTIRAHAPGAGDLSTLLARAEAIPNSSHHVGMKASNV